jgi:hypothetical protein
VSEAPIPMILHCPECRTRHVDVGEFATKVHHTHSCQSCGLTWRPAIAPTVGVQFLPGFKNADASAPSSDEGGSLRPHHLWWTGTEWIDERCGCRYHPDDDNGSHGGAPHIHHCPRHATPTEETASTWEEQAKSELKKARIISRRLDALLAARAPTAAVDEVTVEQIAAEIRAWGLRRWDVELVEPEHKVIASMSWAAAAHSPEILAAIQRVAAEVKR